MTSEYLTGFDENAPFNPSSFENISLLELLESYGIKDKNFSGMDFSSRAIKPFGLDKADFSKQDLKHADFSNSNLTEADFSNCDLTGADLSHSILNGTSFEGSILLGVNFSGSNKADANLINAIIEKEAYPEINIAAFDSLEIIRPVVEIAEEDIDELIENLRSQQTEWVEIKRKCINGDIVGINFEGSIDGMAFDGGSAENFDVELGKGRMLKVFEEGLLGMVAGEEKEIGVLFPDEYPVDDLKGKNVQFKLKVNVVKEARLPEVDEEFIEKFSVDANHIEGFREEIKQNMKRELDQVIKNRVKESVMNGLSDLHDIDLPQELVTQEIVHVRNEMAENAGGVDMSSLPDDTFVEQASRRVKLGLIVGEIIVKYELENDQEKIDDMLKTLASSYEEPQQLIEYYKTNPQAMQTLQAAVTEEMIVDYVIAQAKVIEKEMTFSELMSLKELAA